MPGDELARFKPLRLALALHNLMFIQVLVLIQICSFWRRWSFGRVQGSGSFPAPSTQESLHSVVAVIPTCSWRATRSRQEAHMLPRRHPRDTPAHSGISLEHQICAEEVSACILLLIMQEDAEPTSVSQEYLQRAAELCILLTVVYKFQRCPEDSCSIADLS